MAPFRAWLRQPSRPEYVAQGRIALAVCGCVAVQSVWSEAAWKVSAFNELAAQQCVRADAGKLCDFTSRRVRRGSTLSLGDMAKVLLLEDGRALHRSNLGYSVMLELVSREVSDAHIRLRAWLADVAGRPAPHDEIDLRALTQEHRDEFWAAAERALASVLTRHGPRSSWPQNARGAESLWHLLELHRSMVAGEPPSALNDLKEVIDFSGEPEDLAQLWRKT